MSLREVLGEALGEAFLVIVGLVLGLCFGLMNGDYELSNYQNEVQGCLDNYSNTLEELTKCFDLRLKQNAK